MSAEWLWGTSGGIVSRSFRLLVGLVLACVLGLAGGAVQPAAAAPVDDPVHGIVLTGICPTSLDASKDVFAVHPLRGTWTPYVVLDAKMTPIALLFPYQVTFSGEGLKSRHFVPGETYTRSGRTPKNLVECTFDGTTAEKLAIHVDVTGTVRVVKLPRR